MIITFEGRALVQEALTKYSQNGNEFYLITFQGGLQFSTFSSSAHASAQMAVEYQVPLYFAGEIKPRAHNDKVYAQETITMAWLSPKDLKAQGEKHVMDDLRAKIVNKVEQAPPPPKPPADDLPF